MLHSIFRSHDRFSVISVILLERRFRGNQSILMHIARPIYLWRDLFDGGMRILCSWQFFQVLDVTSQACIAGFIFMRSRSVIKLEFYS